MILTPSALVVDAGGETVLGARVESALERSFAVGDSADVEHCCSARASARPREMTAVEATE